MLFRPDIPLRKCFASATISFRVRQVGGEPDQPLKVYASALFPLEHPTEHGVWHGPDLLAVAPAGLSDSPPGLGAINVDMSALFRQWEYHRWFPAAGKSVPRKLDGLIVAVRPPSQLVGRRWNATIDVPSIRLQVQERSPDHDC